jgi:magnesium-transporting ATPase (P-type)
LPNDEAQGSKPRGRKPIDVALQVFAMRFGNEKDQLLENLNLDRDKVVEHPFNSATKMSFAYENTQKGKIEVFMKSASEVMLPAFSFSTDEKIVFHQGYCQMENEALRAI